MKEKIKLSGRELDVMNVLWESDKPLTAKNIVDINPQLSINTVQAVLKTILKKNFIKVAEIVYSGTVLTRSYEPVLTADDYMINQITKGISKQISTEGIIAALLNQKNVEEDTIEKLEALLQQHREKLKKE